MLLEMKELKERLAMIREKVEQVVPFLSSPHLFIVLSLVAL